MTEIKKEPLLRFPEFDENWDKTVLQNVCEVNPRSMELPNSFIYIDLESVNSGKLLFQNKILKDGSPSRAQRLLESGDIIYQTVRPYQKNNYLFDLEGDYVASTGYAQLRSKQNNSFLYQLLHTEKFVNRVLLRSTGSNYPSINSSDLKKITFDIPSLPEQQKIGDFLTAVDKRNELLEKKKKLLETYKKSVIKKILNQEIRFRENNCAEYPDWKKFKLNQVLFEHKERNTESKFDEVFSVSKHKGVVNQIEHLGRSYSAKTIDHYKLINNWDVVYTKSPTSDFPFGIIKQNTTGRTGVLSPLYGVFKPKNKWIGKIIASYFESWVNTYNYLVPLVQKGAKNTMNINNDTFLDGKEMSLPTSENEQEKISKFLLSIENQIELLETQIDKSKTWKKGLLQKMFV